MVNGREVPLNLRVDQLLVERGLVESRVRAQALILAGEVLIDGQKADKPGRSVGDDCRLELLAKLPGARSSVAGAVVIGASLIGFWQFRANSPTGDLNLYTVITERVNLQFRAEFFNLLNHTNLGTPNALVFSGATVSPSAGLITSTATTSRQIQFGMKLIF